MSKRLLITDPDVINSRLNNIEQSLVQLRQDKAKQDGKINHQETINNEQKVKLTQQETKIKSLEAMTTTLQNLPSSFGSTDIRWGKTSCPLKNGTNMVYTEFMVLNSMMLCLDKVKMYRVLCATKKDATSTLMIPGRKTCYSGWDLEYYGYLASGYHDYPRGVNYVCIDINPDYLVAEEANTNDGPLLGHAVGKCGTLKCPPYHNNYPITCVVCSK